jgi:hypothetical protein
VPELITRKDNVVDNEVSLNYYRYSRDFILL